MGTEAARLKAAIRAIEGMVERDGPSRFAMSSLARLHAMRALALAGTGAYSEALVEIAMAVDHDGSDEHLRRTERQLTFQMESIRQTAAGIRHVDPRINPEDLVLISEARRGFQPMQLYRASRRAVQTRALARSL